MVMRHFEVPTRLLDWSRSPFVAAFFAVTTLDESDNETKDGAIWAFDYPEYVVRGREQWNRWPEATLGRTGHQDDFRAELTAFAPDESRDWFICAFYPDSFPRQTAQQGAFSATSQFGVDHAVAASHLLEGAPRLKKFVVPARLKNELRIDLRDRLGIQRTTLFPDSAGAAATVKQILSNSGKLKVGC